MKNKTPELLRNKSHYFVGLGIGFFLGGLSLAAYTRNGWIYVAAGALSMIAGGILGSKAKRIEREG